MTTDLSDAKKALLRARLGGGSTFAADPVPTARISRHDGPADRPPLSFAQERLWFLEQLTPGSGAYHLPIRVRITGDLDVDALKQALADVTARHEALRTVFPTDQGAPTAVVLPPGPVHLEIAEFNEARAATALTWLAQSGAEPFDLSAGPLIRANLARLSASDHCLAITVHHMVADGWSTGILLHDLWSCYEARVTGTAPNVPDLRLRYGDVAAWQRSRVDAAEGERDLAAWRRSLAGVPPLDLPVDRVRPGEFDHHGAWLPFLIAADTAARVEAVASALRVTPFAVLLTAYEVLLGRWCAQTDFAVGTPVSGRGHPDLENLVGMFVNTIALRADLGGDPTFRRLAIRTASASLDAFQRDYIPFERVVTELDVPRDTSRSPVYQSTFALQDFERKPFRAAGLSFTALPLSGDATHVDLALYAERTEQGLACVFTYRTALFDEKTIADLAERFDRLLNQVCADPDLRLSELRLTTPEQRERELTEWNSRDIEVREPALLHALFAEQAARTPDAVAVVCRDSQATYSELDRAANLIAHQLTGTGVRPDDRVAVLVDQSVAAAAAVLGVLKAGAAYVPLDPRQPAARLELMAADAGLAAIVADAESLDALPPQACPVVIVAESESLDAPPPRPSPVVIVASGLSDVAASVPAPNADVDVDVDPQNLAYVIYTSGSTGVPKGVAVAHQQAATYVEGVIRELDIQPGARHLLIQSLSFDFGLTVLWGCLLTGGSLHLLPPRSTGREIADYLRDNEIDYLKLTPSHFEALTADATPAELLPRRTLVFGGESSSWPRTRALAQLGMARVINHYGPTEATVGVATFTVDPNTEPTTATTPIGIALPGARVYVLDDALEPVPTGAVGELFLGGDRLARGYLGRPGATADRFVPDPFTPGARLYRSGDLGRRLPDGSIEFLGRRDFQVKIRGHRVEPGEIEAALAARPGIRQAVVVARPGPGGTELIAYLVAADPSDVCSESDLRNALRDVLPDYLVPSRFVWLDRLPLAAHGKVDRSALPEPPPRTSAGRAAPESELETLLTAIFADALELPDLSVEDDFFDSGGHSLLGVRVVARLREALPPGTPPVSVMDLFRAPTPRALARLIEAGRPEGAPRRLLHRLTPDGPARRHLVCAPYGGGSALIYLPLAGRLPPGWALHSIAVPGHELGEEPLPTEQVAEACAAEILDGLDGPVTLYGHCGLGVMLTVEIARRLEAAGRPAEAVYLGGIFPFARPPGLMSRLGARWTALRERLGTDRWMITGLAASGLDVDAIDPEQLALIVRNRRTGTREAEAYFGELFDGDATPSLSAPVIAVVGDRDPATEFSAERYREWHALTSTAGLVVLDEAGHFFVKHRAGELATIVTSVAGEVRDAVAGRASHDGVSSADEPGAVSADARGTASMVLPRPPGSTWWLAGVSRRSGSESAKTVAAAADVHPSMARFLAVVSGQAISMTGSALAEFAVPVWVLLHSGSLTRFALFTLVALVPGLLTAPLAGAVVDRSSRRRVMLLGDCAAGGVQAVLAALYFTGTLQTWHLYALMAVLSVALTFQRLAYGSAVAQLVPKRYLGRANGIVQTTNGLAQFVVPVAAVGVLALVGLGGILAVDVASYAFAAAVTTMVRFPQTAAWKRRESLGAEIKEGFRFSFGHRGLRALLLMFAAINVFLAPMLVLVSPLVLSFAPLRSAAVVGTAGAAGAVAGGLAMSLWGGPRRRRMRAIRISALLAAVSGAVAGALPTLGTASVGVFGLTAALALMNGVYATIVLVKVPMRFHGRVFALNTLVAWSTIPLAAGVLGPLTAGRLGGVGHAYEAFAVLMAATVLLAGRFRAIASFDDAVPDATNDEQPLQNLRTEPSP